VLATGTTRLTRRLALHIPRNEGSFGLSAHNSSPTANESELTMLKIPARGLHLDTECGDAVVADTGIQSHGDEQDGSASCMR